MIEKSGCFLGGCLPYDVQIDGIVSVDEAIAHPSRIGPRDVVMGTAKLVEEPLDGFAQNHKLVQHGRLHELVCLEGLSIARLLSKLMGLTRSPGNV